MEKHFIFLIALILVHGKASGDYLNSQALVPNALTLSWNFSLTTITAELRATNVNWVIFGLQSQSVSSSGTTDWVVAWLSKTTGLGHFSDRFSYMSSSDLIQKDLQRDWTPLDARFDGSDLVVQFSRTIMRCDGSNQDVDIELGPMMAKFAMGSDSNVLSQSENISLTNNVQIAVSSMSVTLIPQSASSTVNLTCPVPPPVPVFDSQPTGIYTNQAELIPYVYRIYWNFTQTSITGEVHVKTTGWVGFGLSPDGGMRNADVFVGWITNDGHVNFTDRYIDNAYVVRVDQHQDWQMLHSREQNGYTVFKFTRLIKTCDSQDREIEVGSPHVIYAYGNADPATGGDISYHGFSNRGAQGLVIISSSANDEPTLPDNTMKLQFSISNVIIPRRETYYYNVIQKVPDLPSKMHILKYELSFSTMNFANMHHFIYYDCANYNGSTVIPPGDSVTSTIYDQACNTPAGGWAVGAALSGSYPSNTGMPIGNGSDYTHLRTELHYNNPSLDFAYIDNFTFTLYITSDLREHEVAMLILGANVDPLSITIPPGETNYNLTTYCYNQCLRSKLNGTTINIIKAFPHTHLTGTRVSTRLIRNGTDMGVVYENPYYDFNFQQTYTLYPPMVITPDDELVTQCTYNTMSRTNFTYGGLGTKQEMCIQYVTYWPRIPKFSNCISIPSASQTYDLLMSMNRSGLVNLRPPTNGVITRTYVNNGLMAIDQTSPLSKLAIEQFNSNHSNMAYCGSVYDATARGPIVPQRYMTVNSTCTSAPPLPTTTARTTTMTPSPIVVNLISMVINAFQSIWSFFFH